MTIQKIIDELKNIREQATNHNDITKESVLEAITDIIHDCEGSDYDFSFDEDYDFGMETDFTELRIES